MSTIPERLARLFEAERAVRTLHSELAAEEPAALLDALVRAKDEAFALGEAREAELRLVRVAELAGEVEGPRSVDLLLDVLGAEQPEARLIAGEVLEAVAFDRFKEVALGVERALERFKPGNLALGELPYLLAEVGEPGCVKLIGRFLGHADPDAVASAIEALVELGDPQAASLLTPLFRDARQVQIDDEGEAGQVSIGALAEEARGLLDDLGEQARRANAGPGPSGGKKPRR